MPYLDPDKQREAHKRYRSKHPEVQQKADKLYRMRHPDKLRARNQDWHSKNTEQKRVRRRQRDYGLSPETYQELLTQQNGLCAVCGKKKLLTVDHCHQTGQVRGLLCQGCNSGLGHLGDTIVGLEAAIRYLKAGMH